MKCELYQFYPEVYPFNLWIYVGKDVSGMVECFNNDFSYVYNSKAQWMDRKKVRGSKDRNSRR